MSMYKVNQEIPIKSFSIAAFILKIVDGESKYLIIKRSSKVFYGCWQMVSGKLELGENAVEAAIREIKEETGLTPSRFYSANILEQFYDTDYNVINLVPVFVAFVEDGCEVVLNSFEHSEYKWVSAAEAEDYLVFDNQIENLRKIEEQFVKREPNEYLKIDV